MKVQATQRLICVESESKDFDYYLKFCVSPIGADYYKGDQVGEYGGCCLGDRIWVTLDDGSTAYTDGINIV